MHLKLFDSQASQLNYFYYHQLLVFRGIMDFHLPEQNLGEELEQMLAKHLSLSDALHVTFVRNEGLGVYGHAGYVARGGFYVEGTILITLS